MCRLIVLVFPRPRFASLPCPPGARSATAVEGQKRGKIPGPRRPPSSVAGGGSGGRGGGASGEVGEEGPVLHVRWAAEDPNPRAGG